MCVCHCTNLLPLITNKHRFSQACGSSFLEAKPTSFAFSTSSRSKSKSEVKWKLFNQIRQKVLPATANAMSNSAYCIHVWCMPANVGVAAPFATKICQTNLFDSFECRLCSTLAAYLVVLLNVTVSMRCVCVPACINFSY